ncbi:MAG: PhoH family protein, partial [Burkholderiaceae bacterium]|nr:PhoH family protein [Burkholderiaceae bacterium]
LTYFTAADVVRHPLVARIVEAYEAADRHNPPPARTPRARREVRDDVQGDVRGDMRGDVRDGARSDSSADDRP